MLSLLRSLSCSAVSEFNSLACTRLLISNQRSAPDPGFTNGRLPNGSSRLRGCLRRGLLCARSLVHKRPEEPIQIASLLAVRDERARLVDGGDHRGRRWNAVKHRLIQRLLNLLQTCQIRRDFLGVAI